MLPLPEPREVLTDTTDPPRTAGLGISFVALCFFSPAFSKLLRVATRASSYFFKIKVENPMKLKLFQEKGLKQPLSAKFKLKQIAAYTKGAIRDVFTNVFFSF